MAPYRLLKKFQKIISCITVVVFVNTSIKVPMAFGQVAPRMPVPGVMVHLSPEFAPALLRGMIIHPENAFNFDFIIYKGDQALSDEHKKQEYTKLIKYFLASLAVPDEDQWVNLSPYEKNRIIKEDFGKTQMGRDLLAQDYLLKQITASLIYPKDKLGANFWDKIYSMSYQQFGSTNVPVNTFNKVWIVPDEANIYETGNVAYLYKSHLKVMLEEDYLSLEKHNRIQSKGNIYNTHGLGSQVVREIVLPQLEKEVNEGKNFAPLRQVFGGMILAAWYKRALRESLLSKIYANKAKVKGVDQDPKNNEIIYQQYLKAFKKGVFNFIKEDVDKYTNETIPRKYFSGGAALIEHPDKKDPTTGLPLFTALTDGHSELQRQAASNVLEQEGQGSYDIAESTVDPNAAMNSSGARYRGIFNNEDAPNNVLGETQRRFIDRITDALDLSTLKTVSEEVTTEIGRIYMGYPEIPVEEKNRLAILFREGIAKKRNWLEKQKKWEEKISTATEEATLRNTLKEIRMYDTEDQNSENRELAELARAVAHPTLTMLQPRIMSRIDNLKTYGNAGSASTPRPESERHQASNPHQGGSINMRYHTEMTADQIDKKISRLWADNFSFRRGTDDYGKLAVLIYIRKSPGSSPVTFIRTTGFTEHNGLVYVSHILSRTGQPEFGYVDPNGEYTKLSVSQLPEQVRREFGVPSSYSSSSSSSSRPESEQRAKVNMRYDSEMTYDEIDRHIDEIPRSFRPEFGFILNYDGASRPELTIKIERTGHQISMVRLTGFTAYNRIIYVSHIISRTGQTEFGFIDTNGDYTPQNVSQLPEQVRREFGVPIEESTYKQRNSDQLISQENLNAFGSQLPKGTFFFRGIGKGRVHIANLRWPTEKKSDDYSGVTHVATYDGNLYVARINERDEIEFVFYDQFGGDGLVQKEDQLPSEIKGKFGINTTTQDEQKETFKEMTQDQLDQFGLGLDRAITPFYIGGVVDGHIFLRHNDWPRSKKAVDYLGVTHVAAHNGNIYVARVNERKEREFIFYGNSGADGVIKTADQLPDEIKVKFGVKTTAKAAGESQQRNLSELSKEDLNAFGKQSRESSFFVGGIGDGHIYLSNYKWPTTRSENYERVTHVAMHAGNLYVARTNERKEREFVFYDQSGADGVIKTADQLPMEIRTKFQINMAMTTKVKENVASNNIATVGIAQQLAQLRLMELHHAVLKTSPKVETVSVVRKGGIDLNAANLNLRIKRGGKGVPLPISQQNLEDIHIDGLIPVILNIKPAIESTFLSEISNRPKTVVKT